MLAVGGVCRVVSCLWICYLIFYSDCWMFDCAPIVGFCDGGACG